MRVLALGGAGGMGIHACRVIAERDSVTELTVTDLNGGHAERAAAELGPRARGRALDVTDERSLRQAMGEADAVLNTVGPFFRFGVPILRAAIDAGCRYVDICDDWEPLEAMLALDGRARTTGATALIGMGASPGMTNLLAVRAAAELDAVEELFTGWNIESTPADPTAGTGPSAAIVHGIQQITGRIEVTRRGLRRSERPLKRADLTYPGAGRQRTWTFGHPEAITLPRTYKGVTSLNVTYGSRQVIAVLKAIGKAVDLRLLTRSQAARLLHELERRIPPNLDHTIRPGALPPIFALARGRKDGQEAAAACALAQTPGTTMGEVTGIPMAIALTLLEGSPPGVHTPESLLNWEAFFAALAPYCVGAPSPRDMLVTTRSWDPNADQTLNTALNRARTLLTHR